MEEFFGGRSSSPQMCSTQQRSIKRGVWASSIQEEDHWIASILSLQNTSKAGHVTRNPIQPDRKLDNSSFIHGTEIPKIFHFIWLGPDPIPRFRSLLDADITKELNDGEQTNGLQWNECMMSWKKHHPSSEGWVFHLWTDHDIIDENLDTRKVGRHSFRLKVSEVHNYEAFKYATKIHNYGLASDILRLEILNRFGGIYLDVDYWCVRCIHEVSESTDRETLLQLFCGASNAGCIEINNGLMACREQGHPILLDLMKSVRFFCNSCPIVNGTKGSRPEPETSIELLLSSFLDAKTTKTLRNIQLINDTKTLSPMSVIEHTGPGLLTRTVCRWLCNQDSIGLLSPLTKNTDSVDIEAPLCCIDKKFGKSQVMVFHSDVFHPFPNHMRGTYAATSRYVFKNTIAVHLWGCSWQGVK